LELVDINFIRFFAALFSGILLSLSGSLIQGVTQNDLAGPSTLVLNAFVVLIVLVAHALTIFIPGLPALEYLAFMIFIIISITAFGLVIILEKQKKKRKQIYANQTLNKISFFILCGCSLHYLP